MPFRYGWSLPSLSGSGRDRHGSRPAPPLAGSPARIGCVVCSSASPSQTALYSLWEKCWQNHLDTPKGPHLGAINRTTTGHIPKPYCELVTQLGDVGHIAVPLSRPARGLPAPIRRDLPCQLADTGGPIRLPGEKSHEPDSTHPRRPPRNRDWLLRCLSSGFVCMLS